VDIPLSEQQKIIRKFKTEGDPKNQIRALELWDTDGRKFKIHAPNSRRDQVVAARVQEPAEQDNAWMKRLAEQQRAEQEAEFQARIEADNAKRSRNGG
jgi:hypothetical protein